jgi:hypothetical protein
VMLKIIAGRKRKLEDITVTALDGLYPTNLPSFRHPQGERDLRVKVGVQYNGPPQTIYRPPLLLSTQIFLASALRDFPPHQNPILN